MALFGSDRPVLPSFRTAPELDSNARSPYDDLNRIERAPERNAERNPDRNAERNAERNLERNGRQLEREARDERSLRDDRRERDAQPAGQDERRVIRNNDHDEAAVERQPAVAAKALPPRATETSAPHPLIAGLFDKLPEPDGEWPLQARLKWLQTAANIFDLMYTAKDADGELSMRLEKNATR